MSAGGDRAGAGGFVLETLWRPVAGDVPQRYRLVLHNRSSAAIAGFRLAFSGLARTPPEARITGGRLVRHLSNYTEIAPDAATLGAGDSLAIDVEGLEFSLRHWTDGAAGAFLIGADGVAMPVAAMPTRLEGSADPMPTGTMRLRAARAPAEPLSILPWPREVAWQGLRSPPPGFAASGDDAVAATFAALTETLFPGTGLARPEGEGGLPVRLALTPGGGADSYVLTWDADGAGIAAPDRSGLLYGLIVLAQMQRGARHAGETYRFPAEGRIADAPGFGWRGCHLDVARRFYGTSDLRRFLAILAWNRLNVFHWHLSDDEAWRVEIGAYPGLTRIGAWRGHGLPIPPLLGSGPERTGGVYTQAAVREIVSWAGALGIRVVPEVDIPGHCHALLMALPQLRDPGETGAYHSIQSFPNNCLNPGVEAVYPALETILGELCDLFPAREFHVGADEVPEPAWSASPAAAALAKRLGTTGSAPLQAHFLGRVQAFLSGRGKVTGAWEEAAEGGGIGRADSYLVGWRTAEASRRLAAEGYGVVAAPAQAYYLDMANSHDWQEPGAGWAGATSPETTYAFDPAEGWSAAERSRLLGVQGCIWSETMRTPGIFDRLIFPRLSAIAETGWRGGPGGDWDSFAAAAALMPNQYGVFEGETRR